MILDRLYRKGVATQVALQMGASTPQPQVDLGLEIGPSERPLSMIIGRLTNGHLVDGRLGPGVLKVSETVSRQSPESQNRLFWDSGDCLETVSDTFGRQGQKGPGDSLETLSGFRVRRRRETPVRGRQGCKL